jgi:hypothetical protein
MILLGVLFIGLSTLALLWLMTRAFREEPSRCPSQMGGHLPFAETIIPSLTMAFTATAYYRTKSGQDFHFRFQQYAEGFRVYILEIPFARQINAVPHVLHDAAGPYVCWSCTIGDYQDAKEIAAKWAEAVEQWHTTGKSF